MVKIPPSNAEEAGSISHQGSRFPQALGCSRFFFFFLKGKGREIFFFFKKNKVQRNCPYESWSLVLQLWSREKDWGTLLLFCSFASVRVLPWDISACVPSSGHGLSGVLSSGSLWLATDFATKILARQCLERGPEKDNLEESRCRNVG